MFNERNHLILGKYELNNIKIKLLIKRFKKGDTVSILGFNVDDINKNRLY